MAARARAESPSAPLARASVDTRTAIERTVGGLGYELVDIEREPRGLLRVTIDRLAERVYPSGGDFITVDDCERVTRQLQYVLEVEGAAYARLEVSSPGLDRPLKTEAHFRRFAGEQVSVTLKEPLLEVFVGRKVFKGRLGAAPAPGEAAWSLVFDDGKGEQVLGFTLDEIRSAHLVPVLDFKGRRGKAASGAPAAPDETVTAAADSSAARDGGQDR